ncbi:hypothetical protein U9M48_009372 [Paspalum notatum var. saurae]|uniref:RNase H type-1 domain-containing protein n=1 Tax=Paspalum notatum var. saurae TaxID=547442 RepID=A0AAQ3WEW0_PASNO
MDPHGRPSHAPRLQQDIASSSSNKLAPNHVGFYIGITSQTGSQCVDLNHMPSKDSGYEDISHSVQHTKHIFTIQPGRLVRPRQDDTPLPGRPTRRRLDAAGLASVTPPGRPGLQQMMGILHFDGASQGNPGNAGAGAVLMTEDGRVKSRLREGLGAVTNNIAEYRGLILGLKYAIRHGFKRIKVYGDSQLVCNQVNGVWKTKKQYLKELRNEVIRLKEDFHSFEISHVRRELNAEADRQANIGITLASGFVDEELGDF